MKISVIAPMLNERRFVAGWYENVKKFCHELVVVDMNSTDGTYEFLQGLNDRKLHVRRWPEVYPPYQWPEHEIRNWLIKNATGDFLIPLDADEMVDDDFIENLNHLPRYNEWLIGRFVELKFWGDFKHLRKRSVWPPIKPARSRSGRRYMSVLSGWRGMYPCKQARIFRRIPEINYARTGNHCLLQYKNWGRMTNYSPKTTRNFRIPFYHFHYVYFGKQGGNRECEKDKKVKLVEYHGKLPEEVRYYEP